METQSAERLEYLMHAYGTDIKRFCTVQLRDAVLAEDAAQEVFLKAWRALETFRGESSEKTWLIRIALNTCRDYQRTGWFRFMDRRVTPEDLPEVSVDFSFEDGTVAGEIASLPSRLKAVILLRYYEGMSLRETADALNVSIATVKRRQEKANQILRRNLKGWYEDEE